MKNTDNDSNTRDDCSRSHALAGSALPLAMAIMASAGNPWGLPYGLKSVKRHSSQRERYDPNREKTEEDRKRIEAAKQKRERKAARRQKLHSQNGKASQTEAQPRD